MFFSEFPSILCFPASFIVMLQDTKHHLLSLWRMCDHSEESDGITKPQTVMLEAGKQNDLATHIYARH